DDQAYADRRREVVHDVALVDELADDRRREHRVDDKVESRVVPERLDVAVGAGREVVDDEDLGASIEEIFREVRADEARPARDQRFPGHRRSLARPYPRRGAGRFNNASRDFRGSRLLLSDPPIERRGCVVPLGYTGALLSTVTQPLTVS